MKVVDLFDRGASLYPDRTCLIGNGLERSYREVRARTEAIAAALHRDGSAVGRKVAIYSHNDPVVFECMIGVLRAGGTWVPINSGNHRSENEELLRNFDVSFLFYQSRYEEEIAAIRSACPAITQYVCVDQAGIAAPSLDGWVVDWSAAAPTFDLPDGALAGIYSTGGTTGRPKGAMWTAMTWQTMVANFFVSQPCRKLPVHLVVAPMSHAAGGMSVTLSSAGATNVILPRFDAGEVLAAIEQHHVTHLFLPPTAIYMLLAHPNLNRHDYSSLECFLYAAAPMSIDKLRLCIATFGPVMAQCYGQSEAPMFCTYLSPAEHRLGDPAAERTLASCGRPTLLTPVAIMDDHGNILAADERGEVVVRGNLVMAGYYKNPEATNAASEHGWHHTGDVGYKDAEGYVYITDRKRDMIISGGFNIYPVEIEQVIWSHPAVLDCAVIGVPDKKWGEAVKAVIECRPGQTVSEEDILVLCKSRLGSKRTPKSVEIWDSLPRSPVGKVLKKLVRERFWTDLDRKI
jgi:acyl-CoA synthetase (AMP-forming)/AMP-acid ligase II